MAGCVQELRARGFSDRAIVAAFEAVRPRGNALESGAMQRLPIFRRASSQLRRLDAPGIALHTLDGFLGAAECAQLISIVDPFLGPSTRNAYDPGSRTSRTAFAGDLQSAFVDAIDARICGTLGIDPSYAEGIQFQHYAVGQQFKPHYDFFEPGTHSYERHAGVRGNRTWTFMVYLNEGMEGGATRFNQAGVAVQPRAGMALFWNNLNEDGSPNKAALHCGEPVTRGVKVIITKWFRVHGDGPVLHE
jgi:prolyl 4-hydroxylase